MRLCILYVARVAGSSRSACFSANHVLFLITNLVAASFRHWLDSIILCAAFYASSKRKHRYTSDFMILPHYTRVDSLSCSITFRNENCNARLILFVIFKLNYLTKSDSLCFSIANYPVYTYCRNVKAPFYL